jgi:hypothetical protein
MVQLTMIELLKVKSKIAPPRLALLPTNTQLLTVGVQKYPLNTPPPHPVSGLSVTLRLEEAIGDNGVLPFVVHGGPRPSRRGSARMYSRACGVAVVIHQRSADREITPLTPLPLKWQCANDRVAAKAVHRAAFEGVIARERAVGDRRDAAFAAVDRAARCGHIIVEGAIRHRWIGASVPDGAAARAIVSW